MKKALLLYTEKWDAAEMFRLIKIKRSQKFAMTKRRILSVVAFDTNSVFLPDDVVNGMKRMTPQQNVEFLLNNR